jgi:hypothetical protein
MMPITLLGFAGKPITFIWQDVDALAFGQSKKGPELRIGAGKLSGSIPLDDLDVEADRVWQTINECAERANRKSPLSTHSGL